MKFFYQKLTVSVLLVILSGFWSTSSKAQVLYSEGFTTITPLPTGWAQQNLSAPVGTVPGWFQGNATVFPANSGATTAYIGANFNNVGGANTISNWLFMPNVTLKNGDIFTFYTRSITASTFPDRLQVRLSSSGASVNAGASATSVGDFTTLLLDINPTYTIGTYPQVWTQYTLTLSGLAGPVSGRLAFRYFVEDGGPNGTNSDYIGIDDVVYTTFAGPCSGTPVPGNTISSVPDVCPGTPFTLSFQNNTASGLTYQWQSSPDNLVFTNITGATLATLTTTQNAATWYRVQVTCTGLTAPSTPLLVAMSPATACYCTPPATNCNLADVILNVTVAGINNTSTCGTNGYTNYLATVAPASVIAGGTYPMSVSVGPGGTEYVGVWIDANQNGGFEASEFTLLGSGNGVTISGNLTVPANALVGTTRMRVRVRFNVALTGTMACIGYTYGETEDYAITINPCTPVSLTSQPVNATIQCGGDATFSITATGSGPAFKWQERTSASALWVDLTNTGVYSGVTTSTLTITGAPTTMNGYQYRAIYSGYCRALDYSSIATLTVNQLVTNVTPTSAVLCNGAIQQLTINNVTSPLPGSLTVASGPLTLTIPDDPAPPLDPIYLNGANTSLNVTTLPATALITGISVKLNMNHTYVGDIVGVLKAPNGQILNLDYYLTGTGGGVSTGFVNTVISSAGSQALGTGTSPYTGTFRADASTTTGNAPAGPTGFAPTTTTWTALATNGASANGNWTLAMYDGGPIDEGQLTSWEITFNYLAGIPATGVWNPTTPTNTIFTDAAATIPYVAGTPANSVYVMPTATTNYEVVITTPLCVSGVTTIPVTVSNPVGTITAPRDTAICANNNASFTVSAASGNAITYQWQISTDGGATWTNLANSNVYAGVTTATLTLTAVPANYTNYKYRAVLSVAACTSTANSPAATLTVNPLPVVVIEAGPYTQLHPGITTTLTAAVSPNAAATYQWYMNGVPIPGANAATYVVNVDALGEYSASVVDVNGCEATSLSSINITAASSDIMFIYPSPNNGQFQVRYQSLDGNRFPRTLNVYDSKGSRVFSRIYSVTAPYSKIEVDLRHHGKGVYRVELGDRNGARIKTGSVVIF